MRLKRTGLAGVCLLALFAVGCGGGSTDGTGSGDGDGTSYVLGTSTTMEGVWKAASADVYALNPNDIQASVGETFDVPSTVPDVMSERGAMDQLIEFSGTTLYSYSHYQGDDVYFRTTDTLVCIPEDNSCTVTSDPFLLPFIGLGIFQSRGYTLTDGRLVQSLSATPPMQAPTQVMTELTYGYYSGTFPPAGWPTTKVDLN
jgi:hypothetical protein